MDDRALYRWSELIENVNGRTFLGQAGVRDPEYPCEEFDAQGYQGDGRCQSDGHYMCTECSHLSPHAERFHSWAGRGDRLLLFWRRRRIVAGDP